MAKCISSPSDRNTVAGSCSNRVHSCSFYSIVIWYENRTRACSMMHHHHHPHHYYHHHHSHGHPPPPPQAALLSNADDSVCCHSAKVTVAQSVCGVGFTLCDVTHTQSCSINSHTEGGGRMCGSHINTAERSRRRRRISGHDDVVMFTHPAANSTIKIVLHVNKPCV